MTAEQERALLPCPFCGPGESVVSLYFDDMSQRYRVGCGRCGASTGIHPRDKTEAPAIEAWNRRAALQSQPIALLAKKHTGMMVDYTGMIGQAREALKHGERSPAIAEMLSQLARHLKELGEGWYSGDTAVVDEFLQLYCVEDDARRRIEGEGT